MNATVFPSGATAHVKLSAPNGTSWEKDGTTESGGPGYLVHFDPNERREVRAASDARLVLVLGPWPGEGHPSGRPASAA